MIGWLRRRGPRKRDRVLNPGGEAVLIGDTSDLSGDELLDAGDGRMIRLADLMSGADAIPVHYVRRS